MSAEEQREKFSRAFAAPHDGDVLTITLERKHVHWTATSKNFPGFFVVTHELDKALDQVAPALKGLWEIIQHPEKYGVKRDNDK